MSHHLDSEEARRDPRLDISDVYVFRGNHGTAFVMNLNPLSGTGGFHPEAIYEFKIDINGDAVEDVTMRVTFSERDAAGSQKVTLKMYVGSAASDRDAPGVLIATGVTDQIISTVGGMKLWAGSAGEPFFIEAQVVTAVRTAVGQGTALDLGDFDPSRATNLFADTNVSAIVLELPKSITGTGVIGFWGTSVLPTDAGGWRQINRAAKPLINTIFDFTHGGVDPEAYNDTEPSEDAANYGNQVVDQTAAVVAAMETARNPRRHGILVRGTLFPDTLRYRVGTTAHFGVREQNGRGLIESTPEAVFEIVLNTPVKMGLDASTATGTLRDTFPYLSLPI